MSYVYRIWSPQDKEAVAYALSWVGMQAAKKKIIGNGYRACVRKLKLCCVPKDEMEIVKCLTQQ